MADPITLIGVGISAFGAVKQQQAMKKQERAQRQQVDEQKKLQQAQAVRQRQQTIREGLRKQAMIANQAAAQGIVGGSAAQGGMGALSSEIGGNINYINTVVQGNQRIADFGFQATKAGNQAATYGSVMQLGMAGIQYSNEIGQWADRTFGSATERAVASAVNSPRNAGIF